MMDDYYDRFYNKLTARSKLLHADNYAKAKEIVRWKEDTASKWDSLEVVKLEFNPNQQKDGSKGKNEVFGRVVIDRKELTCDLGVEGVVVDQDPKSNEQQYIESCPFELVKQEGNLLYFETRCGLKDPGAHQFGLRIYPKHPDLPHRMDFAYMRWI
jgi:starch phosphorylase